MTIPWPVTIKSCRPKVAYLTPYVCTLDLNDIMFFIKNLKTKQDGFDIKSLIPFVTGNTHLATSNTT